MRRPRHRPLRSGRLSLSLLSALALIAFACLPALAQAECVAGDSSCAQYQTDIPTVGNGSESKPKKDKAKNQGEPKAEASEAPSGGGAAKQPAESDSGEGEEQQGTATGGAGNGGGNGPADKGSSPAGNGSDKTSTGIGDEQALGNTGGTAQGQNASHSDGGSSPLVPILIAIAVLAAISIGAVIYRQRRQGGTGSPVSPNA